MKSRSKADTTRMHILNKAFDLVYKNGYQATSIDEIIATTQVTKGALYYHFKNKDEMGLAVIREIMYPAVRANMIHPLAETANPQNGIYKMMKGILEDEQFFDFRYGCPTVNLIEEMAPLDPYFSGALKKLVGDWQSAIIDCLEKGKKANLIRNEVNSEQVAIFILSGYSGARNLGKLFGKATYNSYLQELKTYLAAQG